MIFNSIDFAVFLPVVFLIYWSLAKRSLRVQNLFIAFASYFFYSCWDWRFVFLILFSTVIDYLVGRKLMLATNAVTRKFLLGASISVNIGTLGFFKYYDFFLSNFVNAFHFFGQEIQISSIEIILPVGISFYTFQTLSYTIDVYRRKINPIQEFIPFAAFVSFFPQLVAGPIERAQNLLPQFQNKREFSYEMSVNGLRQILWGLFKKIVIADNCAVYANEIFNTSESLNGSALILGAVFFAFQIYCDFSGYSDIAIGLSRLFGFNLMKNFSFPYFSRDIAEFWRRWHISLSTWFRDYVYFPLGGSRCGRIKSIRNVFIIFLLSGFWHGPNWTFVLWGALNAIYFLPLMLAGKNRQNLDIVAKGFKFPSIKDTFSIGCTFGLTLLAWIFFRADSIDHAVDYIGGIASFSVFELPDFVGFGKSIPVMFCVLFFVIVEWIGRENEYAIEKLLLKRRRAPRHFFYYFLIFLMLTFGGDKQDFIYFQF